ncbi:MAG: heparinase II/III family protein [Novosphingobium sp.]
MRRTAMPAGETQHAARDHTAISPETKAEQFPDDPPALPIVGEPVGAGGGFEIADFSPPAVDAGDRFVRFAYRIGVPASVLSAPFAKPQKLRLLATVANPLPGDRVRGTALRAGHFLVHGAKLAIPDADFSAGGRLAPPFARVLHGFDWLADLEACGARPQLTPLAEEVLAAWLIANPAPPQRVAREGGWTVERTGWRVLNWLVHSPLILSGSDRALRSRALESLADQARWLDRHAGQGEDLLAETAGWCAVVAAGLLLPEGRPRRLLGEAGLIRTLGELVGNDGGTLSRSPLAQMEAIALLVKLRACYRAIRRDPPPQVTTMIAHLVPPLLALTHADGSLGSWQGGWAVSADRVGQLVEASGVRARPPREAGRWGYQRVVAARAVLQFDAAPPPPQRHARLGCASTLAFEFSHADRRLIVNCGGAAAAGGLMPLRLEQALRATAAHSALTLDDSNSTAIERGGAVGRGVGSVDVERRVIEAEPGSPPGSGATRIEASHDGYAARYGLIHRRTLTLRDDGGELHGEDMLLPSGRTGKRGRVRATIRFHLGPDVAAELVEGGDGAGLTLPDGGYWLFCADGGELSIEESLWADGEGRPVTVQQLVLQAPVTREGGVIGWLFSRME